MIDKFLENRIYDLEKRFSKLENKVSFGTGIVSTLIVITNILLHFWK